MAAESVQFVDGGVVVESDSESASRETVLRRRGPHVEAAGAALGTLRRGLRTLRLRPRTADGKPDPARLREEPVGGQVVVPCG